MQYKEYIETGYVNNFIDEQGEIQKVFCSKEDFESNDLPILLGYTFLNSQGGVLKVDTGTLKPNEYTIVDGKYFVCTSNEYGESIKEYSEEEFKQIWQ